MKQSNIHSDIEKVANDALNQSISSLPDETSAALALARAKALEIPNNESTSLWRQLSSLFERPMLLSSVVAAALVIVVILPSENLEEIPEHVLLSEPVSEIELAMIEDIEFATWLSEQAEEKQL